MAAFVASRRDLPGVWGANDCATAPADLGVAMGCADFLDGLRGYDSARGAMRKLRAAGYRDLSEMAAHRLKEIPRGLATRGDVALLHHDGKTGIWKYSLSIIDVDGSLIGPGDAEWVRLPRALATRAFRIP